MFSLEQPLQVSKFTILFIWFIHKKTLCLKVFEWTFKICKHEGWMNCRKVSDSLIDRLHVSMLSDSLIDRLHVSMLSDSLIDRLHVSMLSDSLIDRLHVNMLSRTLTCSFWVFYFKVWHFFERLQPTHCRLTSLYLQENHGIASMNHGILWAGTGDGRIVLIDSKSGKLIVSTHRYYGPIRALKSNICKSKWQQTTLLF